MAKNYLRQKRRYKLKPLRVYTKLTNRQLLSLFKKGEFRVENENGKPVVYRQFDAGFRHKHVQRLTVSKHTGHSHRGYARSSGTWYYRVVIYYKGTRKHICLHKLCWMVANQRLVPSGHQLHHRKGKEHNLPCDIDLWTDEEHKEHHDAIRSQPLPTQAIPYGGGYLGNGYTNIDSGYEREPGDDSDFDGLDGYKDTRLYEVNSEVDLTWIPF